MVAVIGHDLHRNTKQRLTPPPRRSLAFFRPNVSSQSFSERQLYVLALDRLCEEIAFVEGIAEEQAVKDIQGLVKVSTPKQSDKG